MNNVLCVPAFSTVFRMHGGQIPVLQDVYESEDKEVAWGALLSSF